MLSDDLGYLTMMRDDRVDPFARSQIPQNYCAHQAEEESTEPPARPLSEWPVEPWQMRKFRSLANVDDLKTRLITELAREDLLLDDIVARPARKKVPVRKWCNSPFRRRLDRSEAMNQDDLATLVCRETGFAGKSY